ncbi:MAG: hypothetical protein U1E62_05935 [Alsobacter sp.]
MKSWTSPSSEDGFVSRETSLLPASEAAAFRPHEAGCGAGAPGFGRRAVLVGLAAAALAAALPALPAFAQQASAQQPRFSRVVIDTSPLAASGASQLGENIKPMLYAGVVRAMAPYLAPKDRSAPVLVVTIKSLQLPSYGGNDDNLRFGFGGGGPRDYLDTTVTVVSGRKVVSTIPLLINQPSSSGGPWFVQPNEDRRVAQLGVTLGEWVRRKVVGS